MPSTHQEQELIDLRERVQRLETVLVAVRAAAANGEPDWQRRCHKAASALRELLELPDRRPGAWESAHVNALGDELRVILGELMGGAS